MLRLEMSPEFRSAEILNNNVCLFRLTIGNPKLYSVARKNAVMVSPTVLNKIVGGYSVQYLSPEQTLEFLTDLDISPISILEMNKALDDIGWWDMFTSVSVP